MSSMFSHYLVSFDGLFYFHEVQYRPQLTLQVTLGSLPLFYWNVLPLPPFWWYSFHPPSRGALLITQPWALHPVWCVIGCSGWSRVGTCSRPVQLTRCFVVLLSIKLQRVRHSVQELRCPLSSSNWGGLG
jgi:hypothetical protein